MTVVEGISLSAILVLCVCAAKSDLCTGLIRNKLLAIFAAAGLFLDVVYYGCFMRDTLPEFLLNFGAVSMLSLVLFYTHSLAGGDCKLLFVLALMYPARFYLIYNGSAITLVLAVLLSLLFGYCYLLCSAIWALITRKRVITRRYIWQSIRSFLSSYLTAMLYISAVNVALIGVAMLGLSVASEAACVLCMAVTLMIGRFPAMRKAYVVLPLLMLTAVGAVLERQLPISRDPENYLFAMVLMLFQMLIRTNLYESVPVSDLKPGMILSAPASVLMQSSITRGLPGVSTEDLKSRLSQDEVDSIQLWARAVHVKELQVVRKMPFAIFIALGFGAYHVLWRVLA